MFIEPRPGPRVVLLSAEAIGQLDGASVEFYSSPAIVDGEDLVIGEQLDELEGTIIEAAAPRVGRSGEHGGHRGRGDGLGARALRDHGGAAHVPLPAARSARAREPTSC